MDLIEMARQFGEEIQSDELYIKVRMDEQKLELDEEFQKLMKEFNEAKALINEEISKETPSQDKIENLNKEISEKYEKITKNPNMMAYQESQKKFMEIINTVNSIILKSARGENPYAEEPEDYLGCSGECSGCTLC
jgi:Uncharacterized conserved protein